MIHRRRRSHDIFAKARAHNNDSPITPTAARTGSVTRRDGDAQEQITRVREKDCVH
jgi:hypothetical protein